MDDVTQTVGDGSNAVVAIGHHISVVIGATPARLPLEAKHRLNQRQARTELELLHTEGRKTTLVGRAAELAALRAWLAGKDISVRCLTGQAGSGKTRLGIDLCEAAEAEGWQAGFIRLDDLRGPLSGGVWDRPTLVVVDYAAASAPALKTWLEDLATRPPGAVALRILLLERHAATDRGWWEQVFAGRGYGGRDARDLLDPREPLPMQPLDSEADRRALLAEVMRLAGELPDHAPGPPLPAPGLEPEFDQRLAEDADTREPLFLAMAGIVAVTTGAPAALALSRVALAHEVAQRETRRLERLADAKGIAPPLLCHLAACVTLQGGGDTDVLERLVTAEAVATGWPLPTPAEQVANLLRDTFPAAKGGGADAIRPDLIGEAFLLRALRREGRQAKKQADIVERAYHRAGIAVVRTVLRTAQDFCEGDRDHPSLLWLDRIAGPEATLDELVAIADELPQQSVGLRERAAALLERIASHLANLAKIDEDALPILGQSLNNLAVRLSDLGRREEALARAQEAVELNRDLAAWRPDAFRPNLAGSLNNLANGLSELGRREEALARAQEAVELRRALAAQRPDAFRPDLAMSLNTLANRLSDLGRREEALARAREAEELYRDLAAQRPDAFRPDLAVSLSNLANRLSDLGRQEEALARAREAVELYRALAAQRPDAFRPDLAMSLNNLAATLSDLGRREEALARALEAVELYRDLAARRPDAFRPDLAVSLNNLANRLSDLGRREEALARAQEAVELYRALAAQRPDAFRPNLAMSLNNLAAMLSDLGRREDALARAQEAVELHRALAAQLPDAFRPDLARSLAVLANCLDALERRAEAVAADAEAIVALAAHFAAVPAAFGRLMLVLARNYQTRCAALGVEPDAELLGPVVEVFERLQAEGAGTS